MSAGVLLLAAATGTQAYGQYQQAKAAEAQGKAAQNIAEYNAKLAEQEAVANLDAAKMEESRVARRVRLFRGAQVARFGKAGATIFEGSPLEVLADTAYQSQMDRLLTLRSGVLGARQQTGRATGLRLQGEADYRMGKAKRNAGYMKMGGTILSGAYDISQT